MRCIFWPSGSTMFQNCGRNRLSEARGVEVNCIGAELHLEAVNTSGQTTAGPRIVVPVSHVPDLIEALRLLSQEPRE